MRPERSRLVTAIRGVDDRYAPGHATSIGSVGAGRVIGVIGPADSTQLALRVARDEGIDHEVLVRPYASADEAPALATELAELCQVIVFTGRVPYALAKLARPMAVTLQYVPHSGADLYRALLHLQRERRGELPRISLDTIEPSVVAEAYEDLGLVPPQHVLPLDSGPDGSILPPGDITAFHLARYRAGDVDVCVTCLGSVYEELGAAGVPAVRIAHTRTVLRDSLRQAHLAARLAITEAMQPGAVIVRFTDEAAGRASDPASYEAQRRRLEVRMAVVGLAEGLGGRIAELDGETLIVYTNRTTIDAALSRLAVDRSGPFGAMRRMSEVAMGIGLGSTVRAAEENARRALVIGERYGDLHMGLPDGEVVLATQDEGAGSYRLRETRGPTLRVAEELGLGPLAFGRLVRALRQVDVASLTAADLARAYGIEPRSARRLMTSLQRAGIATRMGVQGGPGAGRPQTVYRIDVAKLVPAEEPDA